MKQSSSSERSKQSNHNNIDKYFDTIRRENYNDTFPVMEEWLRSNTNLSTKKSERKYFNMKNYFAANKFKLAYTFLILTFVVAACNYPVTQHENIGNVFTWNVDADNQDANSKTENLCIKSQGGYTVNIRNINGKDVMQYNLVMQNSNEDKANELKKSLEEIPGVTSINIMPLIESVERPVFSAALHEIFKIDITATNMSDQQLADEVTRQLKSAGVENAQVSFERDSQGQRLFKVLIPDQSEKKEGGFDMIITDGNNVNRIKEVRKIGPDHSRFKGKTDSEIKQIVKEDFKEKNLTDDQIEIIRDGDNVKVQVKVKDEKKNLQDETEIESREK